VPVVATLAWLFDRVRSQVLTHNAPSILFLLIYRPLFGIRLTPPARNAIFNPVVGELDRYIAHVKLLTPIYFSAMTPNQVLTRI